MGSKGSVDVVKIVEGGCRGGTGSRLGSCLSCGTVCFEGVPGKIDTYDTKQSNYCQNLEIEGLNVYLYQGDWGSSFCIYSLCSYIVL